MRACGVSDKQGKAGGARTRAGPAAARWARPKAGSGEGRERPRAGKGGQAVGCRLDRRAKCQGRNKKTFSFSFSKFQSIFKWNFEILFEFSNKAHNTKYYTAA
jgi:hypothetical protein